MLCLNAVLKTQWMAVFTLPSNLFYNFFQLPSLWFLLSSLACIFHRELLQKAIYRDPWQTWEVGMCVPVPAEHLPTGCTMGGVLPGHPLLYRACSLALLPWVPPPGQLLLLAPPDQDDTRGIDQSWPPSPNFCQGVVGVREALESLVRARNSCWCPQGTDSFLQESTAGYKSLQQLQGQWRWLFFLTVGQQQKGPMWRNLSNNKKCNEPLASHLWCIFFQF